MSEKRFEIVKGIDYNVNKEAYFIQDTHYGVLKFGSFWKEKFAKEDCKRLNDICELIEELHTSDHMGWERAEKFEKKCPKELHNKEMYIKRLEYKVQKFKEENEQLKQKIQRWKTLYELKDKEVTARVDALNKVCEYYTSEVLFKSDVDPNKAVKEVINEILNTEVEMW